MRSATVFLAALIVLASNAGGADPDLSRPIIEKAIAAMGGAGKFEKFQGSRVKTKGTLHLMGGLEFTQEVAAQAPNKFKDTLNLEVGGNTIPVITVFDGEKGWLKVNGEAKDVDDKILTELKEVGFMMRAGKLTSLLSDKSVKLAPLGELKVEGEDAVGVQVSTKGFRDINMYFSKKSGLPIKVERRIHDLMADKEVTEERFIQEYQDVEGMKAAKKVLVLRDGKKFLEAEVTEIKLVEKIDKDEFVKP